MTLTRADSRQRAAGSLGWVVLVCFLAAAPALGHGEAETAFRGKTVAQWADQLADKDVSVRWYATHALGQIGPKAAAAVPALKKVLENRSEHEYVRGGAARALGCIGPAAESAVPLLIETSASEHHISVRRNSAWALGRLGPAAKQATPALLKRLDDPDATVRVNAAVAMWRIDRHARAIPVLSEMARRAKGPEAYQAAEALGELGKEAEGTTAALVEVLRRGDEDAGRAAVHALGRLGAAALPAIKPLLDAQDETVRRRAVEALGQFGPAAVPALVAALRDSSGPTRATAARALGRMGPSARDSASALLEAVNDKDQQVRETAAWALKQIGAAPADHPSPANAATRP